MLKACLIGVSGFGAVHYKELTGQIAAGRLQLAAATVVNPEQEAEKCAHLRQLGCELFADYPAMLERFSGKADICFIPTGIHWHAPMTLAALRAGMNVFVEKPAAATIEDVRAMQDAARQAGRFVAVGYQTLYATETVKIKTAILERKIGTLQSIKCRALWARKDKYFMRNNWAGALKAGERWVLDSPFNNALAHQLNMICFLAGPALERSADLESVQAELYRARKIESADTACLRMKTAQGTPLLFYVTHACTEITGPEILITGSHGRILWTTEKTVWTQADGSSAEEANLTGDALREHMLAQVLARVTDPAVFISGLEIASRQTLCVNGAHDSSPIHTVEARYCREDGSGPARADVISGIGDVVNQAFESGKLFSEIDVPWAKPGITVPLREYRKFGGGRTAQVQ